MGEGGWRMLVFWWGVFRVVCILGVVLGSRLDCFLALLPYDRGGTICYFSVNIRDRVPGHMVLDAFCPNKTDFFFENFEN